MSFSSRLALLIGFGGLLLIMALAGIDALRVLQQFRHSDEEIRRRYLSQNHVLNDIRSDVYVSGTYVRDYLLEPDPERAEAYRTSLEDVRKHMESALEILRPPGNSGGGPALFGASGGAGGLLGNLGSHLSMGSRGKAPFGIHISAGRGFPAPPEHAGDRRPDRRHQRAAVDRRERPSGFSAAPLSDARCW